MRCGRLAYVRSIRKLRICKLRIVDSQFLRNPLWTQEFHPCQQLLQARFRGKRGATGLAIAAAITQVLISCSDLGPPYPGSDLFHRGICYNWYIMFMLPMCFSFYYILIVVLPMCLLPRLRFAARAAVLLGCGEGVQRALLGALARLRDLVLGILGGSPWT